MRRLTPQSKVPTTNRLPRRETGTRKRALATAANILRIEGYSRLTMERIAEQSGVAKTTLYRRWPTKAALCMELYLEVAQKELQDPNTGNIADDLTAILLSVVRLQTRTVAGPALIGVLTEAQSNRKASAQLLADFAERRRSITRRVLQRAIDRGEIAQHTNVDLVIDALGGATTFRLLQGHAPLSPSFAAALVKLVLHGCKAPRSRRAWQAQSQIHAERSRKGWR